MSAEFERHVNPVGRRITHRPTHPASKCTIPSWGVSGQYVGASGQWRSSALKNPKQRTSEAVRKYKTWQNYSANTTTVDTKRQCLKLYICIDQNSCPSTFWGCTCSDCTTNTNASSYSCQGRPQASEYFWQKYRHVQMENIVNWHTLGAKEWAVTLLVQ